MNERGWPFPRGEELIVTRNFQSEPIVTYGFSWRTLLRLKWGKQLRRVYGHIDAKINPGEFRSDGCGTFEFSQRDAKLPIRIDYEYTPK